MHVPALGSDGVSPRSDFLISGRRYAPDSPEFADGIASAYATHHRPRCLCVAGGVEMYVAHLGDGFIVKRMPGTGGRHAPDCPSYEPPAEFSGLGGVLGSAIRENPVTGETALSLGFSMSKISGRWATPNAGGVGDSVSTDGTKLSLRGLLHYLWDQAELTRWQPGFAGKRSWATVRRHLLLAAEHKVARGDTLTARLYIPEVFSVEQRDAINARRSAQWPRAVSAPGKVQHLMLMIAEVKEIVPVRYGFTAVVKHVPDQAFALDEQLYRQLGRRFEAELSLWATSNTGHMVMIATFGVCDGGVPAIAELTLMPVTAQWLPVDDSFEQQLIERLVRDRRSFVKGLRYNMAAGQLKASACLTDVGSQAIPLYIATLHNDVERADVRKNARLVQVPDPPSWTWVASLAAMPQLPRQQPSRLTGRRRLITES